MDAYNVSSCRISLLKPFYHHVMVIFQQARISWNWIQSWVTKLLQRDFSNTSGLNYIPHNIHVLCQVYHEEVGLEF